MADNPSSFAEEAVRAVQNMYFKKKRVSEQAREFCTRGNVLKAVTENFPRALEKKEKKNHR